MLFTKLVVVLSVLWCDIKILLLFSANTTHWSNVGLTLGRRLRRWPNLGSTLFDGLYHHDKWSYSALTPCYTEDVSYRRLESDVKINKVHLNPLCTCIIRRLVGLWSVRRFPHAHLRHFLIIACGGWVLVRVYINSHSTTYLDGF